MSKYTTYNDIPGKVLKFNQKMFDKYDIPARNKIKELLGDNIIDNPNKYGQDMIINIKKCKYKYLELQVCTTWYNDRYPHKTAHIASRKIKYGSDTLFLTFDKHFKYGMIFDTVNVDPGKPKRKEKYSREYIYDIPWNDVYTINLNDLDVKFLCSL